MIGDPLIEEIYKSRQKLLDACGNDLRKLMERLRAAEAQHPDRVVTKAVLRERLRHEKDRRLSSRSS